MIKNLKYILPAILLISACTKEINMEIKDNEKKLVVNGVFNVGGPVSVTVSKSKGMLEKSSIETIDNAEIKLYENGVFVTNLDTLSTIWSFNYNYDQIEDVDTVFRNTYYSKDFVVETGKSYSIEISAPGIDNKAQVDIKVPNLVPIIRIDTLTMKTDEWSQYLQFDMLISDPLNEENFYIITLESIFSWTWYDEFGEMHTEVSKNIEYLETDDVVLNNSNFDYESGLIFNDRLFNGRNQNIKFRKNYYTSGQHTNYLVILQSISEDYYNYLVSSILYRSGEGNPIAEPVSVTSNVKNGFGIVTAVNQWIDSSIVVTGPVNYPVE